MTQIHELTVIELATAIRTRELSPVAVTEHYLHRMEELGWITASWTITENKRRARIYQMTRAGKKQLTAETERWANFSTGVARVLRHA